MPAVKHWSAPFFNSDILEIIPLTKGCHHQLDVVRLVDNSYWICKKFSKNNWLGPINFDQVMATESLAATVARKIGHTFAALKVDKNRLVLRIDDNFAVIRPYYHGQTDSTLSIAQAEILGMILAKIHCLKLINPRLMPFPKIRLQEGVECPPWLMEIALQCDESVAYQADLWICSHRDLHMGNLIWQGKENVHLIDWESAGPIHPGVELVGLASNCAGIDKCQFDEALFTATLKGYKAVALELPAMDKILWIQTWHSWLLWYAFLKQKSHTMTILKFKQHVQAQLQDIYQGIEI